MYVYLLYYSAAFIPKQTAGAEKSDALTNNSPLILPKIAWRVITADP